jgi:hypothetical protein
MIIGSTRTGVGIGVACIAQALRIKTAMMKNNEKKVRFMGILENRLARPGRSFVK